MGSRTSNGRRHDSGVARRYGCGVGFPDLLSCVAGPPSAASDPANRLASDPANRMTLNPANELASDTVNRLAIDTAVTTVL